MAVGVIFMTALVPTKGHQFLVEFAEYFMDTHLGGANELHVIISERTGEPTCGADRKWGIDVPFTRIHIHHDDNAPQNPKSDDDPEFWAYWKNVAISFVGADIDFVFASELYGAKVAEVLGAEFVPVDIERSTISVKGTDVRRDLFVRSDDIASDFKDFLKSDVVLFGPESCGKTTAAKRLAKEFNGLFVCEWARPYLETVGPVCTEEKMLAIVRGQYALEQSTRGTDKLIRFLDTDLLSTLGFYRIFGMEPPQQLINMVETYDDGRLYIVMNDNIPFEEDILRYGGDKRESTRQFWIDLLDEWECNYYVVQSTDRDAQIKEIKKIILTRLPANGMNYKHIMTFERD